ncbi:molybdopterin dinucleotide binding domain-containing protein, partial [Tsukamurella soli]|uniref:molybdopterin dinucleotide binding domain-containing protein n=1 Tax=Tsukamurella soli TaxID=644556 RepID=UPI0031E9E697
PTSRRAAALPSPGPEPAPGEARLATWRQLLDLGRGQDGEPDLAGTARQPVVRLSAATAHEVRAVDGSLVTVATPAGAITLRLAVTDMPDRVVWLPQNSPDSRVYESLAARAGDIVSVSAWGYP